MTTPGRTVRRRQVLGMAGGALLAPFGQAPNVATAPPRVVATPDTLELGVVALGSEIRPAFAIRNDGAGPLTMTVGPLGAGLRLESIDSPIAPGASGYVRLVLDTFRAGDTSAWAVPLTTNDPAQPTLVLHVRADVRTFVLVAPPAARFTYVQHEREGGTRHLIGAAGHPDFRVTHVESPYPFLTASVAPATGVERPEGTEGPLWWVTLTIHGDALVGPLSGNVVVHSNHPRQARAWMPVSGFVRPVLAVTPPQFTLPVWSASGQTPAPSVSLLVTNFAEAPLELTSVTADVGGVAAEVTAVDAGRRWRIVVRAAGDESARPATGALVIRTSRADVPDVRVPFVRQ